MYIFILLGYVYYYHHMLHLKVRIQESSSMCFKEHVTCPFHSLTQYFLFHCTQELLHFYSMAQQPLVDQGLLIINASRSH
jgi:hypothetical protein